MRPTRVSIKFGAGIAILAMLLIGGGPAALADQGPSLTLVSPTEGQVVAATDIPVRVSVNGFNLACAEAGRPDRDGVGHIHVMVDGETMAQLTNFYCTQEFVISGQGLAPGQHILIVDLATNTHLDMMETAKEVSFLYQPATAPAPLPQPRSFDGASVSVTAPADGATVGPRFTLGIQATNFVASCNLEGKRNIAGYGHYHVFVDEDPMMMMEMMEGHMDGGEMMEGEMAMMAMPGMISMPCSDVAVDLSAWSNGAHTIYVELNQNDHTPVMAPNGVASISVNLQK